MSAPLTIIFIFRKPSGYRIENICDALSNLKYLNNEKKDRNTSGWQNLPKLPANFPMHVDNYKKSNDNL